ncbi:MAG: aspartate aminotransferase family protein [Aestuariivirga sp.]
MENMRHAEENLLARDNHAIAKLQKLRFNPAAVVGGLGSNLILEDGRRLIDLSAGWGAAILGYGHPAIKDAMQRAAANPAGVGLISIASEPAVALAEKLLALTPGSGDRRVWIGHSASDANEAIVRALKAATCREKFISFAGSWHGGSVGSMGVSGHPALDPKACSEGLHLLPYPNAYRDPEGTAEHTVTQFESWAKQEGQNYAAIFIEPIQSDGGVHVPPLGFLACVADICRKHGILVVSDEAKVGLARTGKIHAFAHEDWVPDIVVFGKGLGGGLPIGAAIGPAEIMDFASGFALQTLHGNPYSTSAALAVLETIERDDLSTRATKAGDLLRKGFMDLAQKHPCIGDVRGRGLSMGVEIVEERFSKKPAKLKAIKIALRAYELGALFYYVAPEGNVLEFTPPLIISDAEIETALGIISQAIADVENNVIADEVALSFAAW